MSSAAKPRCEYCGPLSWTIEQYGRLLHKCGCPYRIHSYCQIHRQVCDEFTDIRNGAWRKESGGEHPNAGGDRDGGQSAALTGRGPARVTQLTELPGTEFEDIFGGAA